MSSYLTILSRFSWPSLAYMYTEEAVNPIYFISHTKADIPPQRGGPATVSVARTKLRCHMFFCAGVSKTNLYKFLMP